MLLIQMYMASIDTIDNIPNSTNLLSYSAVSDEQMKAYINVFTNFNDKFKSIDESEIYIKNISHIFLIYNQKISSIRTKMNEISNNIKMQEKLKDKIKQYIDGTYKCIKINMNKTSLIVSEFEITMDIDSFSSENINKFYEKGAITKEECDEELEWRQIKNTYPTNESKFEYIQELNKKILMCKQDIIYYSNVILRTNISKIKLFKIEQLILINKSILDIYKEFNIDAFTNVFKSSTEEIPELMEDNATIAEDIPMPEPIEEHTTIPMPKPIEEHTSIAKDIPMPELMEEHTSIAKDIPMPELMEEHTSIAKDISMPEPLTPLALFTSKRRPTAMSLMNLTQEPMKPKWMPTTPSPPPPEVKPEVNIAPYDIILEKICNYGRKCSNINNPIKCGYNHAIIGTPDLDKISVYKIKKGTIISTKLCKDDKPWINVQSRCHNINCTAVHCSGRVNFLMKFKNPREFDNERKRKREKSPEGYQNKEHVSLDRFHGRLGLPQYQRITPRITSRETPRDTPRDTPRETSRDTPRETPRETPRDTSRETSRERHRDTPRDTSRETSRETSRDTPRITPPSDTPHDTLSNTPNQPSYYTQSQPSYYTPGQPSYAPPMPYHNYYTPSYYGNPYGSNYPTSIQYKNQ